MRHALYETPRASLGQQRCKLPYLDGESASCLGWRNTGNAEVLPKLPKHFGNRLHADLLQAVLGIGRAGRPGVQVRPQKHAHLVNLALEIAHVFGGELGNGQAGGRVFGGSAEFGADGSEFPQHGLNAFEELMIHYVGPICPCLTYPFP